MKIYDDITGLIGDTPLVRLNRMAEGLGAAVAVGSTEVGVSSSLAFVITVVGVFVSSSGLGVKVVLFVVVEQAVKIRTAAIT